MLLPLLASTLAFAFDHSHAGLQRVLDARLAAGRVDYAALHTDHAALDAWLAEASSAPVSTFSADEKKAFWINTYNAITLRVIADAWPVGSPRDIDGGKVWDSRRFLVGGTPMTLNDIENKVLRPMGDPRIHAALNCGAVGCPPLSAKVFVASSLGSQLDAASRRWAATATVSGGVLSLSQIFDWYGEDFVPAWGEGRFDIPGIEGKAEAAANFVAFYAPDKAASLRAGGYTVRYLPYDWRVNTK